MNTFLRPTNSQGTRGTVTTATPPDLTVVVLLLFYPTEADSVLDGLTDTDSVRGLGDTADFLNMVTSDWLINSN